MRKNLGRLGSSITFLYLLIILWLTWNKISCLPSMPLNELGDFLAGAFGPLAILWLVLGFFQQGNELRINSEALNLQAQELRNSVQQQTELATTSKAQFDLDKAALEHQIHEVQRQNDERIKMLSPRLEITGSWHEMIFHKGDPFERFVIKIHNHGHELTELKVIFSEEISYKKDVIQKNNEFIFDLHIPYEKDEIKRLTLRYFRADHKECVENYIIIREGDVLSFAIFESF